MRRGQRWQRWQRWPAVLAVGCAVTVCLTAPAAGAVEGAEEPWVMHTITSGPRGADGVNLADVDGDGDLDVTTAWEQAGLVIVSLQPDDDPREPWQTVTVGTGLFGVEDAIFADVDADGHLDVVSACECRRLVVHFGPDDPDLVAQPQAWTSVELTAAADFQRWIKVAVADVDGDNRLDIIGGGKVNPATVGWLRAPQNPRDGSAWTYTPMSPVAWTMSLVPRDADADGDTDVVLTDRTYIINPDGTRTYHLRGTRWLENTGGADWVNHPIGFAGGEHKFIRITDFDGDGHDDVLDGASGATYNRTFLRRNLGQWGPWEVTEIPQPADVGYYQDVAVGDVDLDGVTDLVFSYSHAEGELSGVVWSAATENGWERREISGSPGTKYDNVELVDFDGDGDLDAVTSEQIEQLGVIWYENPTR